MNKLLEILEKFSTRRLLVIGDLMLDRFIWGDVERISPEAPVPVLRVTGENFRLGGAANVMHNICSLGGKVSACGVVGRDTAGRMLLQRLKKIGISTVGVRSYGSYTTVQKNRIIAGPGHQQIVRLDRESSEPLSEPARNRLRQFVSRHARQCHGIVISDYGKGVIHAELLSMVADLVKQNDLVCVVDPKKENYPHYRFPTLITPNRAEASEASDVLIRDQESLEAAGKKLVRMWQASAVMITRGGEGMSLFRPRIESRHFPTQSRDIFDVTGAGDTVVAVCALALTAGASYEDAAVIANVAAGMVGDEVGTVAVPIKRLKRLIREM
ncbi:MAG TPA: D-glycero-beta-D-manno-heptose-7-phosphate kinase [Candidatus Binatia bacterium]|jgi:D-beta-D-heptose 7-phosphate kinase/D-beta-D-heptose 1-phosphate adenosyltransferase